MTEARGDGWELDRAVGLREECELVSLDKILGIAFGLGGEDRGTNLDDDGLRNLGAVEGSGAFESAFRSELDE